MAAALSGWPSLSTAQSVHVALEPSNVAGRVQVAVILVNKKFTWQAESGAVNEFCSCASEILLECCPDAQEDQVKNVYPVV